MPHMTAFTPPRDWLAMLKTNDKGIPFLASRSIGP